MFLFLTPKVILKKTLLFSAALSILAFSACQKKDLTPSPDQTQPLSTNGYYSDGSKLVFETLEDYERVVDQPTKEIEEYF